MHGKGVLDPLPMNRAKIYILANKIDLLSSRQLHKHTELLKEYARLEGLVLGIVSAKTSEGIQDFFDTITSNLMNTTLPDLIEMNYDDDERRRGKAERCDENEQIRLSEKQEHRTCECIII